MPEKERGNGERKRWGKDGRGIGMFNNMLPYLLNIRLPSGNGHCLILESGNSDCVDRDQRVVEFERNFAVSSEPSGGVNKKRAGCG